MQTTQPFPNPSPLSTPKNHVASNHLHPLISRHLGMLDNKGENRVTRAVNPQLRPHLSNPWFYNLGTRLCEKVPDAIKVFVGRKQDLKKGKETSLLLCFNICWYIYIYIYITYLFYIYCYFKCTCLSLEPMCQRIIFIVMLCILMNNEDWFYFIC